jgi:energy-coupling factor transporter ATP-binding protein EcfA2
MRLMRIKPQYFRAFGDSEWINLNSDLVVIYGPNGFGKTSIAESLEWLLYGKTLRRIRGEQFSQRDFQGSYRNVHAPDSETTYVECEVKLNNGDISVLKRELVIGQRGFETSRTFMEGDPAEFTSILQLENDIFYPIIAQHSLQNFIHSRQKERRDMISAAFGLEPIVRYKTVLDRARNRFQATPPSQVITAMGQIRNITQKMIASSSLITLRQNWSNGNIKITEDESELFRLSKEFLQLNNVGWGDIISELTRLRSEASRRVFDTSPLLLPANYEQNMNNLRSQLNRVHQRVDELSQRMHTFVSSAVSIYSQAQLQFWQTGLTLATTDGYQCPMCENNTLTTEKRTELQSRIEQSTNFTISLDELRNGVDNVANLIQEVLRLARLIFPTFLDNQQRSVLIKLFEGNEDLSASFLESHDNSRDIWQQDEQLLQRLENQVRQIPTLAGRTETIQNVISLVESLENDITSSINRTLQNSESYLRTLPGFFQELEQRISTSDEIREIDAYLAPIQGWRNLVIVSLYNNLLSESLALIRNIEHHIQNKQNQLFSTKGLEINRWYDMMNPNARVRYKKMEPGTDSLTLIAETFGVEINAVSCLSQSQLNCLGLSVHFVRSLASGSPFTFLLMDDPVQSMDDDHREALVIDVINELLSNHQLQLIILTHVQGLADSIWERYFHLSPIRLRVSDFRIAGPVIEDAETLQNCLNRTRQLAGGNEDNRRLALDCLRRSVELLIRETCRNTNSDSPPDDSTARQMIPFFRSCTGTTVQQSNDLLNTIGFCDPAPHTQVGWAAPTQPQIIPHIDRLRSIAQRLGVW